MLTAPVRPQSAQYGGCSLRRMSVMEALELLDQLVDESDPDVDFPNSFHAYQTAEGIRRAHPDKGRAGTGGVNPGGAAGGVTDSPARPQTGSTSWGCCMTWARSWRCLGSPR